MPDLTREAVHNFWRNYEDPTIYRVLCFMEGVEDWTLDDNPALEAEITTLSQELDDIAKLDMGKLGNEELFIRLAGNIKMSRALRMLQAIDTSHPGAASRLLIHAEETSTSHDDAAGLFLRRNIVFERLRLISRVFSPERLKLVLKILEGEES